MSNKESEIRYNLRLPKPMYEELTSLAEDQGTTRLELIRKYIKLGLTVETEMAEGAALCIKKGDTLTSVIFL